MAISNPVDALRHLGQLYERGFRDAITDAALLRVASSQAARDEAVLRDLERDLSELEQQYEMSSEEFFQRWQAGEMADTADFIDWTRCIRWRVRSANTLIFYGARLKRYDH